MARSRTHSARPILQDGKWRTCRNSRCFTCGCSGVQHSDVVIVIFNGMYCRAPAAFAGALRRSNFSKFLHNQRHAGSLNDANVPTVDKIVDTHSPKFHKVQQPQSRKLLNLKRHQKERTCAQGGFRPHAKVPYFSMVSISMRCGRLVESC
jgi:hypothetical protein